MRLSKTTIASFQSDIFSWWVKNKRDLPWRRTSDPYHILISEVMLAQTQVSRVTTKYNEFLRVFPTIESLSTSPLSSVVKIWKGLGYNRRALYLHKLATIVVSLYSGKIPNQEKLLLMLPGVGKYTARAILVFAYRENTFMVDTNIRRIIVYYIFNGKPQTEKVIWSVAEQLVPVGRSWEWHQALMDYGAIVLPKLLVRKKTVGKKEKFSESNRYFRGRIIDELRTGSYTKEQFGKLLVKKYKRTFSYYEKLMTTLSDEGLIRISENFMVTLA